MVLDRRVPAVVCGRTDTRGFERCDRRLADDITCALVGIASVLARRPSGTAVCVSPGCRVELVNAAGNVDRRVRSCGPADHDDETILYAHRSHGRLVRL